MKSAAVIVLFFFAILLSAQNLQTPQPTTAAKDYSFTVPGNQPWTDTSLNLSPGDDVQISDVATSGCGPVATNSTGAKSAPQSLPVPSAPAGSLIAKLRENASPIPAPTGTDFQIKEASHLFLGPNGNDCSGGTFAVKVQVTPGNSGTSTAEQVSQGQKLKQQLGNAAQIWLQGQLGTGAQTSTTSNAATSGSLPSTAAPLKVSDAALDPTLRKDIDGLPRRVNDQLKNEGDMVNFVLVGTEQQVQDALKAADWHLADTTKTNAVVAAVLDTYKKEDYLAMPMSTLYLFGRPQDFGYEQAEPIAMVASRHHFRLWKAPFTWNGQTVWVGAGTHDIGFAKDRRNNSVTHKIDPDVDGERTNIGQSLEKSGDVKSMSYYLPPNPVQDAKVATGDTYHSDGRLLVVFLK